MTVTQTSGPLAGITVLDLSWGIAGPMTSMLLADSGATLIGYRQLRDAMRAG